MKNLLYIWRGLFRSPAFTLTTVLSLALGIGASALMFGVVDAVLLRPLPYHDSGRLVWIWSINQKDSIKVRASYPDFLDWRNQNRSFESIVGFGGYEVVMTGAGEPQRLEAGLADGDLFKLLGVSPLLGSTGSANPASGERTVVLSHRIWRLSFNAAPDVIGRRIALSGQSYTIAGVMPTGFEFPIQSGRTIDFWMNLERFNPALQNRRDARLIEVIGRLRPNVTLEQAQADMNVIAARLNSAYPATNRSIDVRLVRAIDEVIGSATRPLLALFASVGMFLLLACVNIANLLLARAAGQRKENALRVALGASRGRISVHFVLESLLLAAGGGILGYMLAVSGTDMLRQFVPADLPRISEIRVDGHVVTFALVVTATAGLILGLATAWHASSRIDLATSLHEAGHSASEGRRGRRLSGMLVVVEIALAMILLTGAGLFVNSFARLVQTNSGFDPHNVLTFAINWRWGDRYARPEETFRELQTRLLAIPGVMAASTGLQLPDRGIPRLNDLSPFFEVEGRPVAPSERTRTSVIHTQPGYFRAMGIPLPKGRDFDDRDLLGSPRVIIINEAFARANFANEEPVGKRLKLVSWRLFGERSQEIIGVAGDVTHMGLRTAEPLVYVPLAQAPLQGSAIVLKTQSDPAGYANAVHAVVRSMDEEQPVEDVQTLERRIAGTLAKDRFSAIALGAFAVLAVLLAAIGLYGLISHITARRTQEIAIRMALGAERRDIAKAVLSQGMILAAAGLAIGFAGALALTRFIENLLFGVTAQDPTTLTIVALFLTLVAFLACWIPARRAMRMDPVTALRRE
jgi:putative ABC transport system permease protein